MKGFGSGESMLFFLRLCETPIRIKRGSAEADLLELFLKQRPADPNYVPQIFPKEGEVEILLPFFRSKDVRKFNYLSPKAAVCLHECIRNRFKVSFWKDMYNMANVKGRVDLSLVDWMEKHGIEVDDRNYNTLHKIFQRKRAVYCANARLTSHRSSRHKKK